MEKQSITSFIKYRDRGFLKADVYKNAGTTIFVLNLMPGQQMPQHYHPGSQLFFLVTQGNGIFIVNGENVEVKKGDIIHCLGTEKLGFTNTGNEPATIYVSMSKLTEEDNKETC
ncbi:MAG: cupin domain-containing protein [Bacillota bacterium]|nr:cupin domain-containing protein [Bacillota bacterium]